MQAAHSPGKGATTPDRGNRPLVRSRFARSRISNGKALLARTDGRSLWARRFRDLCAKYGELTGDRPEYEDLVRSLAALVVQREVLDRKIVHGELVDPIYLTRLTNGIARALRRLHHLLAEERRAETKKAARAAKAQPSIEEQARLKQQRRAALLPE